jgi:hypothetical protein
LATRANHGSLINLKFPFRSEKTTPADGVVFSLLKGIAVIDQLFGEIIPHQCIGIQYFSPLSWLCCGHDNKKIILF